MTLPEGADAPTPPLEEEEEPTEEMPEVERSAPRAPPPAGPAPLPRRAAWWWARRDTESQEPWSHVARALAYEVLVVLATAAAIGVLAFVALQGRFEDLYLKARPVAPVTGEVALVTLGAETFYLWDPADPTPAATPRALLAEVVRFLDAAGADVIVLDVLLDRPMAGDEALAAAARGHGAVIGAERLVGTEPSTGREFVAGLTPALADAIHGAYANFQAEQPTLFSQDLLVRRVPLVRRADRAQLAGEWPENQVGGRQQVDAMLPSLALAAAWLHAGGPREPGALQARLQGSCGSEGCGDLDLGLPEIPHDLQEPLTINFRGPEHADGIPTVAGARVLRVMAEAALLRQLGHEAPPPVPDDLRRVLEGRVVVVGRVDEIDGAVDRFVTPYGFPVRRAPDMAGARIHAQVVDTLLSGHHIRQVGGPAAWLLALLLAVAVRASQRRIRDDIHSAAWLAVCALLLVAGMLVFRWTDGVVLQVGPPLLGILVMLFYVQLRGWATEQSYRT